MKTKIILTSILAITFALPAIAEITNGATCDATNLGQSENNSTANVEAIWNANTYYFGYRCSESDEYPNCHGTNGDGDASGYNIRCRNATYNDTFIFPTQIPGRVGCGKTGYTFTGWSCVDNNNNITIYTPGQETIWQTASDLQCTAQWIANIINIDWYSDKQKLNVSNTAKQCTYDSTITLPEQPTKTGYTFNGWVLFDICADLSNQQTCNANTSCFWYDNMNKCVPTDGCKKAGNKLSCLDVGYCKWKNLSGCTYSFDSICNVMDTANNCSSRGCVWNDNTQTCTEGI